MNNFFRGETAAELAKKNRKSPSKPNCWKNVKPGTALRLAHALAQNGNDWPRTVHHAGDLSLAEETVMQSSYFAEQGDLPEKYFTWEWLS